MEKENVRQTWEKGRLNEGTLSFALCVTLSKYRHPTKWQGPFGWVLMVETGLRPLLLGASLLPTEGPHLHGLWTRVSTTGSQCQLRHLIRPSHWYLLRLWPYTPHCLGKRLLRGSKTYKRLASQSGDGTRPAHAGSRKLTFPLQGFHELAAEQGQSLMTLQYIPIISQTLKWHQELQDSKCYCDRQCWGQNPVQYGWERV